MQVLKIGGNELDDPSFLAGLASYVAQTAASASSGRAASASSGRAASAGSGQAASASDSSRRSTQLSSSGQAVPHIIVHGGGQAIVALQQKMGLTSTKVDGLRVTDKEMIIVVQMALSGQINKQIVAALLAAGADAIGLSGVDGGILRCTKKQHPTADLGYVGEIIQVRTELLRQLTHLGVTVVLSPLSLGLDGCTYNVNADDVAGSVAVALKASQLTFVSNVPGVLVNGRIQPNLTISQAKSLIANDTITDGMIPKVRAALDAVGQGVAQAQIVNLAGLGRSDGTYFVGNETKERQA